MNLANCHPVKTRGQVLDERCSEQGLYKGKKTMKEGIEYVNETSVLTRALHG